jgi:hypothetical protein
MEVMEGARAESALLAAVIARAVKDCCFNWEPADSAIRFLFDRKNGGLSAYAHWLEIDAESFRQKLLTMIRDDRPDLVIKDRRSPAPGNEFLREERKIFLANLKEWADKEAGLQ